MAYLVVILIEEFNPVLLPVIFYDGGFEVDISNLNLFVILKHFLLGILPAHHILHFFVLLVKFRDHVVSQNLVIHFAILFKPLLAF